MTRQSGLGRGLSALIPGSEPQEKEISEEEERFAWLPLSEVVANPLQPRTRFDDKKQQQLVESVRTHGVLQPILVRSTSFGYEVVAGERRLRAAQEAGLFQIPALVRQVDDKLLLNKR